MQTRLPKSLGHLRLPPAITRAQCARRSLRCSARGPANYFVRRNNSQIHKSTEQSWRQKCIQYTYGCTNAFSVATKRQPTYVLANKRHGVGAHVTIGKNILFFGVEAAVQCTHAKNVTRRSRSASASACFQAMPSHTCAKHRS